MRLAARPSSRPWRPLVALVLALSASGAGGVVVEALERPGVHRCRCRHGPDEDCGCPGCHRALQAAAEDSRLPPCHRAAAKARLARAARPQAHPCLRGSCGSDDEETARAPRHEPLVLPRTPALPGVPGAAPRAPAFRVAGRGADRPATPPPRVS